MKITGKKLFWAFAVIWATVFTTGCNVAAPDPNAVWLELEFPHAKYPFIQYTGILRQITEKSVGECRPLDQAHLTELIISVTEPLKKKRKIKDFLITAPDGFCHRNPMRQQLLSTLHRDGSHCWHHSDGNYVHIC